MYEYSNNDSRTLVLVCSEYMHVLVGIRTLACTAGVAHTLDITVVLQ